MGTVIPPSPTGDTPASTGAEGFLLLTVSNAHLLSTSPYHPLNGPPTGLTGLLSLECVTISVADPMERDVWLVLRLDPSKSTTTNQSTAPFEFPLPSTQKIVLDRRNQRYTMPIAGVVGGTTAGSGGELVLTLPAPKDSSQREDLETLEVILAQYAVLQTQEDTSITPLGGPPSTTTSGNGGGGTGGYGDGDLKGRLVLVDEDNGQVVGMLDDHFDIREDAGMHAAGNEKNPVVVEIPEEDVGGGGGGGRRAKPEIFVHTIPVDDSDWISQTAGFLGRGVVLATNVISTGVTTATNLYISNSKPSAEPIVFSENTRKNIKRVHNISGQAVKVTAKTTGLIHQAVERLTDAVSGGKAAPSSHSSGSKHGLGAILKGGGAGGGLSPGASGSGGWTSSGRNSPSSSPCMMGDTGVCSSKEWTGAYPGPGPVPASSASSIRSGPPPSYNNASPGGGGFLQPPGPPGPPPLPPRRRLLNRLLTSTDLLLTTVESSATHLISHTTSSLSAAAHHKYGNDMGNAVGLVGESVKNVGVVYVDARGVGRRALLKVAGKRVIKGRMGGRDVIFQEQGVGRGLVMEKGPGGGAPGGGSGYSDGYGPPPFPPPNASMPGSYSNSKRE